MSIIIGMDIPLISRPAQSSTEPTTGAGAAPFDRELITISRREYIELQCQARQYQSLHARALKRIQTMRTRQGQIVNALKARQAALRTELEQARAQLRGLRQQAFGTKSEHTKTDASVLFD